EPYAGGVTALSPPFSWPICALSRGERSPEREAPRPRRHTTAAAAAASTARAPKTTGRRFQAVEEAVRRARSPNLGCQTAPPSTAVGAFEWTEPGRWATTSNRKD